MKLWDDIRNYFYKRNLAERISGLKVKRNIINLDDSKSVGIIYDSTNPDNDIIITKFAEGLRKDGKTVDILGYVNDKKIDHKADILVFNKKNLSWTQVPDDTRVEQFAAKKFDLLLACFIGQNLPLEYVAAISNARWRLGVYAANKTEYYDMMINLGEKNNIQYLLDQAIYFLKQIKYDSK
ncbi:MAG: hypothetical protein JWO06_1442 [Bacteroidota bacterium]|nr:hypothetical protein [Bacteroidota bacterium]